MDAWLPSEFNMIESVVPHAPLLPPVSLIWLVDAEVGPPDSFASSTNSVPVLLRLLVAEIVPAVLVPV